MGTVDHEVIKSNLCCDMNKANGIPRQISTRSFYKRKYSLRELYRGYIPLVDSMARMRENRRENLVDVAFIERMQLAVTEVNGCAACSYAHAHMALRQGMSAKEIHSYLSGDGAFIKVEEAKGILFAQHFAESRGCPERDAYEAIVGTYTEPGARIMLAALRIIQAGNMIGIPFSAFWSRLKGKPYADSTLWYEIHMMVGGTLLLPAGLLHGLLGTRIG